MKLSIHERHSSLKAEERELVERRIRFALTRFAPSIREVSVIWTDESGSYGSPAKRCLIVVVLLPTGSVVVDAMDGDFRAALSRAADRAGRTVARQLKRKRSNRRYQRRRINRSGSTADEETSHVPVMPAESEASQ